MSASQVHLFDREAPQALSQEFWQGCFNARESSIQQLAPYIGKMKSGMARALVLAYTNPADTVLDPFSGSGVVPYEAALLRRNITGNDLNPYAYILTLGKLSAPPSCNAAVDRAARYLDLMEKEAPHVNLRTIPVWVRKFFHPRTLREIVVLFRILREKNEYFLLSCLLGILHHVRPGFLSYPSSHLVPYLRLKKYPRRTFPRMYRYRDVRSRLFAKINRAYRRYEPLEPSIKWNVLRENAMCLPLANESVNAVISSPPYFGALDYGRDNRLRLWFLGVRDYRVLERQLTSEDHIYRPQMTRVVDEMCRVVKKGGRIVLVLGNYTRNGSSKDSAQIVLKIADRDFPDTLKVEKVIVDPIPDERRARRRTKTTQHETILVLQKTRAWKHV